MRKYIPSEPYQAKIQIRPLDEKVYSFVKRELKKDNNKITEEFKLKEGVDILVTSSQSAFALAKKFKRQFNGEAKTTRTLVTLDRQKGKRVYRLTICLKLNPKPL